MDMYAIFRRNLCTPDELDEVGGRSEAELARRPDEVRKIRSYIFNEDDGTVGTICVYEAINADVIRDHGRNADVKVSEIRKVTTVDVRRPDPDYVNA